MFKLNLTSLQLTGVWTALVTPFRGGKLDINRWVELIDRAADAGLTGIVPLGTTGETPTLSTAEKALLLDQAISATQGRLKVIVGAGSNDTAKTIGDLRRAADAGADGALVVTPYYNKPTPEGLRRHFLKAADSAAISLVLYHIPSRSGVGIPLALVVELAQHPHIIGIKEAGGDLWRSAEIARQTIDRDFAVLSGDDTLTLPLLAVGAVGVISVISNLAPKSFKHMVDLALKGDFKPALEEHRRLAPLMAALSLETNPGPIKEAMNMAGIKVGSVRLPLVSPRPETRKALRRALQEVEPRD
ncbi:MAG: 4-hydroxy-tetrahydrodipicolinate synthase [Calditrichota bacterium]